MSWTSGSDGKVHSKVQEVQDRSVTDDQGQHGLRKAVTCRDGKCSEAVSELGPMADEAKQLGAGHAADARQELDNLDNLGGASDLYGLASLDKLGGLGGLGDFDKLGGLGDFGKLGDLGGFGDFGGLGHDGLRQSMADLAGRLQELTEGDGLGAAGASEADGADEADEAGDDGKEAGEHSKAADAGSASQSVSRSYSYSNVDGQQRSESRETRCQNGKCHTERHVSRPEVGSGEAAAQGKLVQE